jgi:hypothetical protein
MIPSHHHHGFRARLRAALAGSLALTLLAVGAVAALAETGMRARGERLPASVETAGGPSGGSSGVGGTSYAGETSTTPSASTSPGSGPPSASGGVEGQTGEPSATQTTPAAPGGASGSTETASAAPAPEVEAQSPQAESSPGGVRGAAKLHGRARTGAAEGGTAIPPKSSAKQPSPSAPPPSALTPPLPGALGAPISGVPDFFIESFRIPPFLLPIYQAAGTAYDIPWEVLAAINEVETDYGRDLSVSSAGAEGWMQFLPSSWDRYGVDANGAGYEDPYNPADAIFAAARYLQAAGGAQHIRAAIYAYNHSQAYVESVMLRAQLLEGTPPELLSAITGLTESRFPVHAPAHFTDGFPAAPGPAPSGPTRTLTGTVIYSQAGAPVIAVQDGEVTAVGDSPTLGRYVSMRDAYGNTYTYAQLGSVATLYPVLEPRVHTAISARIARPGADTAPPLPPSAPASAGVQPHSPLSQGAVTSSLAMGAAGALETPLPAPAAPSPPPVLRSNVVSSGSPRVFRAGPDEVYLRSLLPGVQVLAGTVLGHIGAAGEAEPAPGQSGAAEPHMLFQIRPAGAGAPLIDPKPILDGWVRLEETSVFRAKGENPFLATSPTVGQVLLESKPQLEQQVLRDPGVRLARCEHGEVQAGEVDRRALAALEFLSVSGLSPTVSAAGCAHPEEEGPDRSRETRASGANPRFGQPAEGRLRHPLGAGSAGAGNAIGGSAGETLEISAINGIPIAGHEGPGSIADIAVRRLLRLQGTMKPTQIVSSISYPGTDNTLTLPGYRGLIHVAFASRLAESTARTGAHTAAAGTPLSDRSPLTPSQWLQLVAQLGEIPEPNVASGPSPAAIPDPSASSANPSAPSAAPPAPGASGAGAASPATGGAGGSSSSNAGGG